MVLCGYMSCGSMMLSHFAADNIKTMNVFNFCHINTKQLSGNQMLIHLFTQQSGAIIIRSLYTAMLTSNIRFLQNDEPEPNISTYSFMISAFQDNMASHVWIPVFTF